ncbi:MAG: hypothetical protein UX13_C0006G0006 [Candidatus Woesebacteria bacterium GW2011_GWB1_45_5]|uniref:Uncharacterized protein n=1 Tax=Candidatus Woesebacteria bacterium GW2011_GWB1_45_5 TaxID=1618581 RepID=A0A0G1QPW3_9BACT|nr:MAG: hypothetical protein UX13_C0006G0006 [Candidatus Woesebacteria bacterium GW2011_GWB1_45_5]
MIGTRKLVLVGAVALAIIGAIMGLRTFSIVESMQSPFIQVCEENGIQFKAVTVSYQQGDLVVQCHQDENAGTAIVFRRTSSLDYAKDFQTATNR